MVLESEDLSQKAEKVSGPENTLKREITGRKRLFTDHYARPLVALDKSNCFEHILDIATASQFHSQHCPSK